MSAYGISKLLKQLNCRQSDLSHYLKIDRFQLSHAESGRRFLPIPATKALTSLLLEMQEFEKSGWRSTEVDALVANEAASADAHLRKSLLDLVHDWRRSVCALHDMQLAYTASIHALHALNFLLQNTPASKRDRRDWIAARIIREKQNLVANGVAAQQVLSIHIKGAEAGIIAINDILGTTFDFVKEREVLLVSQPPAANVAPPVAS